MGSQTQHGKPSRWAVHSGTHAYTEGPRVCAPYRAASSHASGWPGQACVTQRARLPAAAALRTTAGGPPSCRPPTLQRCGSRAPPGPRLALGGTTTPTLLPPSPPHRSPAPGSQPRTAARPPGAAVESMGQAARPLPRHRHPRPNGGPSALPRPPRRQWRPRPPPWPPLPPRPLLPPRRLRVGRRRWAGCPRCRSHPPRSHPPCPHRRCQRPHHPRHPSSLQAQQAAFLAAGWDMPGHWSLQRRASQACPSRPGLPLMALC